MLLKLLSVVSSRPNGSSLLVKKLKYSQDANEQWVHYVVWKSLCLPWGRFLLPVPSHCWEMTDNANYIFMFLKINSAKLGLITYLLTGVICSVLNHYNVYLQLDGLEKSFYSFYVCTAVRKFFFFLDPLHTGKVKIQDILACSFLDDLLEVNIGREQFDI